MLPSKPRRYKRVGFNRNPPRRKPWKGVTLKGRHAMDRDAYQKPPPDDKVPV